MCWLLDMHGVELSWPEGLPPFVHKLQTDRHFAMDFWALIRSLRRGGAASLSDQQIIALLISCLCGSNSLPIGHDDKAALSELASMLAASAASTESDANLPDALLVPESANAEPIEPEWSGAFEKELEQLRITDDAFQATRLPVNPRRQAPEASHAPTYHLNEALSRLELTSLELKHHLDNLDSRMSRIEPHLEDITSLVASTLSASSPRAPISEVSSPNTPPPPSTPEYQIADTNHVKPIPTLSQEPNIFFSDNTRSWWPTSPLTDYAGKAKAAWANRPQLKSALPKLPQLPKLPPHLLPELKRGGLNSWQFVSSRFQSINPRQIAIVASIVVGALICGTILAGAYRHPAERHDPQPREVKAMEQPAEQPAKPVGDSSPKPTPAVVRSPGNLQPGSQPKTAATPTTATLQTNTPKKKQGDDDYVAKPTFKWLGDNPPDTSARNTNSKTGTDSAP